MAATRSASDGAAPELTVRHRPIFIGLGIGHPSGTAGSIGPFVVLPNGRPGFLSTASVLAPSGARLGDFIHQPGPREAMALGGDTRIARLGDFVSPLQPTAPVAMDVAVAELLDSVEFLENFLPPDIPDAGRRIAHVVGPEELSLEDQVAFVGRTSGFSTGYPTAVEFDSLRVPMAGGGVTFSRCIEVRGDAGPFSQPGDGGALVYRRSDFAAVGIVFASAHTATGERLTYVQPLGPALSILRAELL